MVRSPNYNDSRRKLARVCADALGLTEVPLELMELAVRRSDIPERIVDDGEAISQEESSLLSMGVVYSYAGITKFIARDGHTYILPYNGIVVGELEKCGYVVCEPGFSAPYKKTSEYGRVSEGFIFERNNSDLEEEYRSKATLPSELVAHIVELEAGCLPSCDIKVNEDGQYTYDVFAEGLNGSEDYSAGPVLRAIELYGYDNDVTRKLCAITGSGSVVLSHPDCTVTDFNSFVDYAMQNEYMNSSLYYMENGPYYMLSSSDKKKTK